MRARQRALVLLAVAAVVAGCGGAIERVAGGEGGVPGPLDGSVAEDGPPGGLDGGRPDAVAPADGTVGEDTLPPPDGVALTDGGAPDDGAAAADGPPAPAAPRLIVRFDNTDPAAPLFAWSGSAIAARFSGTAITLRLRDPAGAGDPNFYTVVVDGTERIIAVSAASESYVLADGLAAGDHEVLVWRNTEWFGGETQFVGFDLPGGGQYLPTPAPDRRVEFVGDSITCGYGDLGPDQSCPFSKDTEDHYVSYAGLTARALGADQTTICVSGIGIFQNYGGDQTDTMPGRYVRTMPNRASPAWDFSTWIPQAVVINLGTNDWYSGTLAADSFQGPYRDFLAFVRGRYPEAAILCAVGPMLAGSQYSTTRDWLTELIAERAAAGDTRVSLVEFGTQDGSLGFGCDWHPSVATHEQMAGHLTDVLRQTLGW